MTEQRDIVERLDNIGCVYAESSGRPDNEASDAVVEAAAEITRLREQLRIAREGLEAYDVPGGPGEYARDTLARMDTHTKENA
jgi:hypothetical protein